MSRIGKKNISVPDGVDVKVSVNEVTVTGPKGTLSQNVSELIKFDYKKEEKQVVCTPVSEPFTKDVSAKWGLYRVLINNMVIGVSEGFSKKLIVDGVGYRAELKGKNLLITAGFSHPFMYLAPDGITFTVEGQNNVIVSGIDKQKVGQVSAEIRAIRPPEPFKGKGIRYDGEYIIRKAGKAAA